MEKQNGSTTITIIVDFLKSLFPNTEILYLPELKEIEDFTVDVYKYVIEHQTVPNIVPNSVLFHSIRDISEIFEEVEWLIGPDKIFYILSKYPVDFYDVVSLCDLLTSQEIQKEEVKLLYLIS